MSGALIVTYVAAPASRPYAGGLVGALSLAAIGHGLWLWRPRRWPGWMLLAASVVMSIATALIFAAIGPLGPPAKTYPAANEWLHVFLAPVITIAVIVLARPPVRSRELGMVLDVAGISLTNALVVWVALLRPATIDDGLSTTARVVTFANFVGGALVFTVGIRLILDWYRVSALRWLAVGLLTFIAGDAAYANHLLHGLVSPGGPELGFLGFVVCAGAAALTPSMAVVRSERRSSAQVGVIGVAAFTLCMVVVSATLMFEAQVGPISTGVAFAAAFAGLGAIAVTRLTMSLHEHRRRVARAEAVRIASADLVAATSDVEVLSAVNTAVRSMVSGTGPVGAFLVPAPVERTLAPVAGVLTIPLRSEAEGEPRALRFLAPRPELVELAPLLEAIADHAASALDRIALVTRIRQDEQERYFRTLVMTSHDVTLISRDGRIAYATPSAAELFGYDVRGQRLNELVDRIPRPRRADDGGVDVVEGQVRRPDGSTLIVRLREQDLSDDPHVCGVVTTVRDITAERALQLDLAYRASHDPLTRLANRETFHRQLETAADGCPQAVLFVDLDDFKKINDTYGHHVGDQVLEVVARRIESCLRAGDLAARLGGDEFAVLLNRVPGEEAARAVAERITEALAAAAVVDGAHLSCQASVGLAYGVGVSLEQLQQADVALYAAKAAGKGRWQQFERGMSTPLLGPLDYAPEA